MTEPTHRGDAYLDRGAHPRRAASSTSASSRSARPLARSSTTGASGRLMLAVNDIDRGYFTDQRWVDAVPTMFEHTVLRDTACNVAYWNLHQRTLERTTDGVYTVDGNPLRFFHYSGHDPHRPFQLSKHVVDPDPSGRRPETFLATAPARAQRPHSGDRPRVRPAALWPGAHRRRATSRPDDPARLLGRGAGRTEPKGASHHLPVSAPTAVAGCANGWSIPPVPAVRSRGTSPASGRAEPTCGPPTPSRRGPMPDRS